jgi:hypothetical protein
MSRPFTGPLYPSFPRLCGRTLSHRERLHFIIGTNNGSVTNGLTEFTGTIIVPEPSTLVLFGIGAIGLPGYGWQRRRVRRFASAAAVLLALSASFER